MLQILSRLNVTDSEPNKIDRDTGFFRNKISRSCARKVTKTRHFRHFSRIVKTGKCSSRLFEGFSGFVSFDTVLTPFFDRF